MSVAVGYQVSLLGSLSIRPMSREQSQQINYTSQGIVAKIQSRLSITSFLSNLVTQMASLEFKWKHFAPEIILWCLPWYGSTPMSYANLSDMLAERGISVNRSIIYRAINKQGRTLDFYFSHKRNKDAVYQFIKRCLRYYDLDNQPKTLNTDKHSSYANAIAA